MDWQRLAEELTRLPVEELAAVLRDVFAARVPFPEEAGHCRSRFFLGTAYSDLLSEQGADDEWGTWRVDAVAYPDPARYGDNLGPDYGLCQAGTCGGCGVGVRSNVKRGLCPVCGAAVGMT